MTSSSPVQAAIYVSLTSFLDFAAAKDAAARRTIVRNAKQQMAKGYAPEGDFYKAPRDAIRLAKGLKVDLAALPMSVTRGAAWKKVVEGFNAFVGKKAFISRPVRRKEWAHGDLVVSVNPELALERGGVTTYYKLYFKAETLTKRAAEPLYQMMVEMLEPGPADDVGIVDLRRARLVKKPALLPDPDLAASLRADALSFVSLWQNLP